MKLLELCFYGLLLCLLIAAFLVWAAVLLALAPLYGIAITYWRYKNRAYQSKTCGTQAKPDAQMLKLIQADGECVCHRKPVWHQGTRRSTVPWRR